MTRHWRPDFTTREQKRFSRQIRVRTLGRHDRWTLIANCVLLQETIDAAPGPDFAFGPAEYMPLERVRFDNPRITGRIDGRGSCFYGALL